MVTSNTVMLFTLPTPVSFLQHLCTRPPRKFINVPS